MSQTPAEVLEQARTTRVDLGAFSVEEMWRAGVPMPGVKRRPDPPSADAVRGGMGVYRRLAKAPAPSLAAQVWEADESAGLHVSRLAELLEPHVAKVVELRRGVDRYVVCVQPVELFVAEMLTDAGRAGADLTRTARFLSAFSNRFRWVKTSGRFRRAATWGLEHDIVGREERVYLDIRLTPGSPGVVGHELTPSVRLLAPEFDVTPGMDGIAASLTGFAEALWDHFAPGPRPVSG